jgi:hypothetical protein
MAPPSSLLSYSKESLLGTIALGLRVSDTPPSGGKLFHQKVLADTILIFSRTGICLNGSMFHMLLVRSFIVLMCRSMSGTCLLFDTVFKPNLQVGEIAAQVLDHYLCDAEASLAVHLVDFLDCCHDCFTGLVGEGFRRREADIPRNCHDKRYLVDKHDIATQCHMAIPTHDTWWDVV